MPHIILKRNDIQRGSLQILDLKPNTSIRSLIYDTVPQSKYVDPVERADATILSVGGVITISQEIRGLEAWFLTNIDNGAGAALTPAEATTNVDDVLTLLAFGDLNSAAGTLQLGDINGALTTGSITAGQLQAVLDVLGGQGYTVPAGVQIEAAGAFNVQPAIGVAGGPYYDPIRRTYDTSSLLLSVRQGELAGLLRNDFTHQGNGGTNGEAVVVYNDDGTLFT